MNSKNTDIELWREKPDDYYSPSIHVTREGSIGINVGGHVIVADIRDWHRWAVKEACPQCEGQNETVGKRYCSICGRDLRG